MKLELQDLVKKARRSRRELRGVGVVLLLLGCSTHLAFAHATINLPATPAFSGESTTRVVTKPESAESFEFAREPASWMPPSRRGCRGTARCNPSRRVPLPSAKDAERAASLGLGDDHTARLLLSEPPRPEWVAAVGTPPSSEMLWPVSEGHFGRGVGRTRERRLRGIPHQGVDIVAPEGADIRAVNDALVAYSDNGIHGYGNLVILVHADGTTTHYAHCSAAFVVAGQRVRRGEIIARVGATGLARGAHLHFEWRSGLHYRDPMSRFVGVVSREQAAIAVARAAAAPRG
jgi:hypothetical protein